MADMRKPILADENVPGPSIVRARQEGAIVLFARDLDIPCDDPDFDKCLFDYAIEFDYPLVTINRKDFDWRYYERSKSGLDHPGLIIITKEHHKNHEHIAILLALYADEDLTNRVVWI
jgi:hypothetical protein